MIAIVTGITGQDGAYLAELLLRKGYRVIGTYRSASTRDFWRIDELGIRRHPDLDLVEFDCNGPEASRHLLKTSGATEVYNLAGQSSAVTSLADPVGTARANAMGPLYLLEAIRTASPGARLFQAGSSELYGNAAQVPQVESTAFSPNSPYGVAKLFAHWATVNYREAYGVFGVSGILFNHESPLRGTEFVTRKISNAFARIHLGLQDSMALGNMNAERDWGYAGDYVLGMWHALQVGQPGTYVFATKRMHTVRDFVTLAASAAGFRLDWQGHAEAEVAIDRNSGKTLVRVDPEFYRPLEIHQRVGDPGKAGRELGWRPSTSLETLCTMMVEADIRRNERRLA